MEDDDFKKYKRLEKRVRGIDKLLNKLELLKKGGDYTEGKKEKRALA
jgi:hypothetical protein